MSRISNILIVVVFVFACIFLVRAGILVRRVSETDMFIESTTTEQLLVANTLLLASVILLLLVVFFLLTKFLYERPFRQK